MGLGAVKQTINIPAAMVRIMKIGHENMAVEVGQTNHHEGFVLQRINTLLMIEENGKNYTMVWKVSAYASLDQ